MNNVIYYVQYDVNCIYILLFVLPWYRVFHILPYTCAHDTWYSHLIWFIFCCENDITYNSCGCSRHNAVENERRNEAALFYPWVGLHQVSVITEETLNMDPKRVRAFKVVRQQHRPSHDDHLHREHKKLDLFMFFFFLSMALPLMWYISLSQTTNN